ISDLSEKIDHGEATIYDYADVALDIGATVGGLVAVITGSTAILTGVGVAGIASLIFEYFPEFYKFYTEQELQRQIENGYSSPMPVESG
ncbi:hypothetical protein, partial [Bacillus cereus]|uniref:hypothetical protein n=1 Tax=Bacillus cereus TaxID=1396 RepID=UPI001C54DF35